jgi:hypothetical protein
MGYEGFVNPEGFAGAAPVTMPAYDANAGAMLAGWQPQASQQGPWGNSFLGNRNIWNALAQVGVGLDPNGVGGALGKAAIGFNSAQAASERADAAAKDRNTQRDMMMRLFSDYGGPSPSGTPGVTSVKVSPKGSVLAEIDPELASGQYGSQGTTNNVAPATAPTTPVAPVAPETAPNAAATNVTVPTNASGVARPVPRTGGLQSDIRAAIPFS